MSTVSHSVGLGIQAYDPRANPAKLAAIPQGQRNISSKPGENRAVCQPRRTLTGPRALRRQVRARADSSLPQDLGIPGPIAPLVTLSSATLQSALLYRDPQLISDDVFGGQVSQLDTSRNIDQGRCSILRPTAEPEEWAASSPQLRNSTNDHRNDLDHGHGGVLPRDVTLLSFGGSHARSAAELKSLLGNSNARLKAGSVIVPDHMRSSTDKKTQKEHAVAFEQAKSRARVEVDIVLESNVCVQGGYLRGHIKVRVRRQSKKEGVTLLSEGKLRVIGYEALASEDEHHTFYQCAAPLSAVTDASQNLYASGADVDGFSPAIEGLHVLPFAFKLPADNFFGTPKGVLNLSAGVSVKYIAMVSMKVKDSNSGKQSIAHFYRNCEVWPHLNPAVVLQPSSRPLQASAAKSLALLGNSSKVKLHAQMHRLYWPAGSRCPISLHLVNGSKKTVRSLTLTLVRTVTVFRPRPTLDTAGDKDPDSCLTSTTHKVVAESFLEMCAGVVKGHASAKGWWTGVAPGRELDFVYYVSLPVEALSITRARLLEVEYSIRATASAGSLSPDISVTLPIRIFNFLSIDPPPSAGLLSSSGAYIRPSNSLLSHHTEGPREGPPTSMTEIAALASNNKLLSVTPEDYQEEIPLPPYSNGTFSLRVTNPDTLSSNLPAPPPHGAIQPANSETSVYSTCSSTSGSDADEPMNGPPKYVGKSARSKLGNLDLGDDAGSDEEVKAVLNTAQIDGGHFTSSLQTPVLNRQRSTKDALWTSRNQPGLRVTTLVDGQTPRMEGVGTSMAKTSFTSRVQQKRRALAVARLRERTRASSHASGVPKSVSAFLPQSLMEDSEDDRTPRIGYTSMRENRRCGAEEDEHSSGNSLNDHDRYPMEYNERDISVLSSMDSRQLPRPPGPFPSGHAQSSFSEPPQELRSSIPTTTVPASNSRILPTPPAAPSKLGTAAIPPVPPIPPHILALCSRQRTSESDRLRKTIIRPPRSPLRPLSRDSETSNSSDSGSGVRGRIAVLEGRVRSLHDSEFAYC